MHLRGARYSLRLTTRVLPEEFPNRRLLQVQPGNSLMQGGLKRTGNLARKMNMPKGQTKLALLRPSFDWAVSLPISLFPG